MCCKFIFKFEKNTNTNKEYIERTVPMSAILGTVGGHRLRCTDYSMWRVLNCTHNEEQTHVQMLVKKKELSDYSMGLGYKMELSDEKTNFKYCFVIFSNHV